MNSNPMQFRLIHLLAIITCVAITMSIQDFEVFRYVAIVFWTMISAWLFSTWAIGRNSNWIWQAGAATGVLVATLWYAIIALSWPRFFPAPFGASPAYHEFIYWREAGLFLVVCPIIGAAVAGWVVHNRIPALAKKFSIPVLFSQIILGSAVLFRLLTLAESGIRNWLPLSLFCGLVFVVHTINWLPRLVRSARLEISIPSTTADQTGT